MAESANKSLHILIMAGGSGTRFWPKSRMKRPKQLLKLWDDQTLIEHTVSRFSSFVAEDKIWIVTTEALLAPTREVLSKYKKINFLAEPIGKNTAPRILWGILEVSKKDPQACVAVMAADHFIEKEEIFLSKLNLAVEAASSKNTIVTIGIKPTRPETGFGYIKVNEKSPKDIIDVDAFVEKPDFRTAVKYVAAGEYFWNAGMFVFSVNTACFAFQECMPNLFQIFSLSKNIQNDYVNIKPDDALSFDYGVMEICSTKGVAVKVVPVDCGWNDLGSFPALEEIGKEVQGELITHDAGSNVVISDRGTVALLGVTDLIVVQDGDVTLVAAKDRAQDIKLLLEKVKKQKPELL